MKSQEKFFSFIQKLNQTNIYYILGCFLLVVFLLDYFLIMKQQMDSLNTLNPKLTLLKQEMEETKNNIQKSGVYQTQIARLKEQLKKGGYKIPAKEEMSSVLDGISRIANQNKIKIDQMIPGQGGREVLQKDGEDKYYAFPVLVEAKGGYHDIGRFIDQLEKDSIYKNVSALTVEANAQDSAHHTVKLTIKTILLDREIEKIEK